MTALGDLTYAQALEVVRVVKRAEVRTMALGGRVPDLWLARIARQVVLDAGAAAELQSAIDPLSLGDARSS